MSEGNTAGISKNPELLSFIENTKNNSKFFLHFDLYYDAVAAGRTPGKRSNEMELMSRCFMVADFPSIRRETISMIF